MKTMIISKFSFTAYNEIDDYGDFYAFLEMRFKYYRICAD